MIQSLIQISGPEFLVYFTGLSLACIVAGRLWSNADGTIHYPLPELTSLDAISVSALRGGWCSVIKTVLFTLWENARRRSRDLSVPDRPWYKSRALARSAVWAGCFRPRPGGRSRGRDPCASS